MDCTPFIAAEIVDALPVELRRDDLAAVLGVTHGHVQEMCGLNRVPKPDFKAYGNGGKGTPVWLRESIRPWLIDRLMYRSHDLEVAMKGANGARARMGHQPSKRAVHPIWPFLGIY